MPQSGGGTATTATDHGPLTTDHGLPTPQWKQAFRRRLLAWFRKHRRDLPWRGSTDPYAVWVSEIMLQQTQVVTVIPYYRRFLAAFPTIRALALAPEEAVLKHWEGLGYYRRARQLHRAAQVVVRDYGGEFPRDFAQIRRLPGAGRYTAGAIVSIALDQSAPILEANTVRLFSRLLAYTGDPAGKAGQELLWRMAEALLPRRGAGTLNQAMMELGSLVCTPRAPQCEECPVSALCPTCQTGQQAAIPRARTQPKIEAVREAAVVIWRRDKILLRQRVAGERWAGLWDFPRFALTSRRGAALERELIDRVHDDVGITIEPGERLATLKHGVTRFRITLDCYEARFVANGAKRHPAKTKWLKPQDLEHYPLSVTGRKLSRIVEGVGSRG